MSQLLYLSSPSYSYSSTSGGIGAGSCETSQLLYVFLSFCPYKLLHLDLHLDPHLVPPLAGWTLSRLGSRKDRVRRRPRLAVARLVQRMRQSFQDQRCLGPPGYCEHHTSHSVLRPHATCPCPAPPPPPCLRPQLGTSLTYCGIFIVGYGRHRWALAHLREEHVQLRPLTRLPSPHPPSLWPLSHLGRG